jgi:hypothetical protein
MRLSIDFIKITADDSWKVKIFKLAITLAVATVVWWIVLNK